MDRFPQIKQYKLGRYKLIFVHVCLPTTKKDAHVAQTTLAIYFQ